MDIEFNKNEDQMNLHIGELYHKLEKIYLGGGQKKIDKQHKKGKMTARERVDFLKDNDATFFEIGAFAGYGMYEEHGGCPAGPR